MPLVTLCPLWLYLGKWAFSLLGTCGFSDRVVSSIGMSELALAPWGLRRKPAIVLCDIAVCELARSCFATL